MARRNSKPHDGLQVPYHTSSFFLVPYTFHFHTWTFGAKDQIFPYEEVAYTLQVLSSYGWIGRQCSSGVMPALFPIRTEFHSSHVCSEGEHCSARKKVLVHNLEALRTSTVMPAASVDTGVQIRLFRIQDRHTLSHSQLLQMASLASHYFQSTQALESMGGKQAIAEI